MLIALICFALAFFGVAIAGHSLVILGFVFLTAALLLAGRAWPWTRTP